MKYYTEAQDLQYLLSNLRDRPGGEKMKKLDEAMVELIDQYSLVGFETLAVDVSRRQEPLWPGLTFGRTANRCSSCYGR